METAQPRSGEALAGRVQWMIDHQLGEARIKLNPPELGALDVKVSVVDDKAYVQFAATQSGAREFLEAAMPRLRDLLAAGGLELADATVSNGEGDAGRAQSAPERLPPEPGQQVGDPAPPSWRAPAAGRIDLYA